MNIKVLIKCASKTTNEKDIWHKSFIMVLWKTRKPFYKMAKKMSFQRSIKSNLNIKPCLIFLSKWICYIRLSIYVSHNTVTKHFNRDDITPCYTGFMSYARVKQYNSTSSCTCFLNLWWWEVLWRKCNIFQYIYVQ